ncbi:hypothetical protein P1X14_08785 [Sphingomonas sp. AOB5]|uniref:DUF7010 family protein n=1 Tax=Sphingomonas sp. AOB5 TaxID=3034017 RepID=UPI0023F737D2|nr:hypothetical protein [Sphingomonas sp. AOB5]MDF7775340.1 hypothetical protein [Sphingomonas sp. AOB5]
MEMIELKAALLRDRLASYKRLRGGFPIPLAGTVYWGVLAWLGYQGTPLADWAMFAFIGSGAIFPLALLFAAIFRNPFMKDRTASGDVLLPAFIAMLLFWPMIIAAVQVAPELVPLILAIGMSLHWPVIGWSYGRTALFSAHAIVRAVAVLLIWLLLPEARLTLLPLSVALVYFLTVIALLIDSGRVKVPE